MGGATSLEKSVYISLNLQLKPFWVTPWETMENIWMENKFCVVTWWDSDGI